MCGIAGYFGPEPLPADRVEQCLRAMDRRGPDHQAARCWRTKSGFVHLLHSRLTIIDFDEEARQPFQIGDQSIAFNGELYNYVELRDELQKEGYRFRTMSDTEVLLRTFQVGGTSALDRCEGMWAFAVFDESDGSLVLSRDRFGEKPLYCYRSRGGLYFGSEIKFIVALLGSPLEINYDHLYRYLVNGYKALYKGRHTFFRGLEELPPASILRIDSDGAETLDRYWAPVFAPEPAMTYEEAVTGVRERLIRAMELRLRADVPLAFCMSGGVDSNALISIARRVFNYDVHGFTIINSDTRYEEQSLIEQSVAELGIRHTAVQAEVTDFLPKLRRLVRQHDAPVYTITYYAHWVLMGEIARAGYRVSISGTAADELFSGYYDHFLAYLYQVRADKRLHSEALAAWTTHIQPLVRNPYLRNPSLFVENPDERDYIFLNANEFSSSLCRPWLEAFDEQRYTDDLLRNRMLNELFHEAVPVILHEDDLNAMYFSIENRSPFLDRHLFEFSYRMPTRHLMRDARAKVVLRDAVRGIAPDVVVDNRRKVGFNAPISAFLDVRDKAIRAELLADSPIFDHLNRDRIAALIDRSDLPNSESKFLFYFVNAKLFLEEFAS